MFTINCTWTTLGVNSGLGGEKAENIRLAAAQPWKGLTHTAPLTEVM